MVDYFDNSLYCDLQACISLKILCFWGLTYSTYRDITKENKIIEQNYCRWWLLEKEGQTEDRWRSEVEWMMTCFDSTHDRLQGFTLVSWGEEQEEKIRRVTSDSNHKVGEISSYIIITTKMCDTCIFWKCWCRCPGLRSDDAEPHRALRV